MSNVDYGELTQGYDEAPESHGREQGGTLPAGWYPFGVVATERDATKSGVPTVRLQLAVREGEPCGKRRVFDDVYLGAGKSKYDKDRNEIARTQEEFKKASENAIGRMKGWLKAIGVHRGTPTAPSTSPDYIYQFYSVDQWEGREFMGRINVEKNEQYGDRNRLQEFHAMDDVKKGYAAWLTGKWGKAKIEAAMGKGGNGAGGASVGMTV